ncbi:MAG: hypothetical protein U9N82_10025 [Thermodesulfobacteriota bacterium]|nr:hypothetical protein [Thermodesulfobacteriota bacterium]
MFEIYFKRYWIAIILIVTLTWVVPARVSAYVMPVDQLLGLMADNFSNLKSLVITQTVHLMNQGDHNTEIVLKEKLWLKSPGFYGLQLIGQTGGQGAIDEKYAAGIHTRLYAFGVKKSLNAIVSSVWKSRCPSNSRH